MKPNIIQSYNEKSSKINYWKKILKIIKHIFYSTYHPPQSQGSGEVLIKNTQFSYFYKVFNIG